MHLNDLGNEINSLQAFRVAARLLRRDTGESMHSLLQDIRYALRQVRRAPGFAISVVVVLALGIGANAAMFTVLNGTLFRPLAYGRPGELVRVNATNRQGRNLGRLSPIFWCGGSERAL